MNAARPLRVLLVDDDEQWYRMTQELITTNDRLTVSLDWESSCAAGQAAMARCEHDVWLLDYLLPDGDGIALLKQAHTRGLRVPAIVLTSWGNDEVETLAMRAGAIDYLDKGRTDSYVLARALRDAVERGRVLDELWRSEERYRSLFERSNDAIYISSRAGVVIDANPAAVELFGGSRDELIGSDVHHIYADPRDREKFVRAIESRGWIKDYQVRLRRKDGVERICHVTADIVLSPDGAVDGYQGIIRDVTEQARADQALRASEERYRRIVETASEGICLVHSHGHIEFVNRRLADMLGVEVDEMAGQPIASYVLEDDRPALEDLRHRVTGGAELLDLRFRRKNGSTMWSTVSATAVADEDGKAAGMLAMVSDITDRRELEAELLQAQKMEALGRLTGGIAHDFNNLLTAILGYSEMLLEQIDADKPIWRDLCEIRRAGESAAALTRQLNVFSRKQTLRLTVVDVNQIVLNVERMLRRLIGERIAIEIRTAEDLRPIRGDAAQLEQVLVNLAVNARDAMPDGGTLVIETANADLPAPASGGDGALAAGRYAVLTVCDNGIGMDAAMQARAFEPFFTTKERGSGSGLGLATVYGIVRQLGGHITLESEPGRGTTFSLYLPETTESPAPRIETRGETVIGNAETVLLVEDDRAVRVLAGDTLRRHGYHVLEASTGENALALAQTLESPIDLLLTDVMMPGMSGCELASQLTAARPVRKVLFMSGYPDEAANRIRKAAPETNLADLMEKPFNAGLLLEKVREILERAPESSTCRADLDSSTRRADLKVRPTSSLPAPAPLQQERVHHGRVLIVDDADSIVDRVRRWLEADGYDNA